MLLPPIESCSGPLLPHRSREGVCGDETGPDFDFDILLLFATPLSPEVQGAPLRIAQHHGGRRVDVALAVLGLLVLFIVVFFVARLMGTLVV